MARPSSNYVTSVGEMIPGPDVRDFLWPEKLIDHRAAQSLGVSGSGIKIGFSDNIGGIPCSHKWKFSAFECSVTSFFDFLDNTGGSNRNLLLENAAPGRLYKLRLKAQSGAEVVVDFDGTERVLIAGWVGSTVYKLSDVVTNAGQTYVCMGGGTSAASGGPSGTSGNITDGTVKWSRIRAALSQVDGDVNVHRTYREMKAKIRSAFTSASEPGSAIVVGNFSNRAPRNNRRLYTDASTLVIHSTVEGLSSKMEILAPDAGWTAEQQTDGQALLDFLLLAPAVRTGKSFSGQKTSLMDRSRRSSIRYKYQTLEAHPFMENITLDLDTDYDREITVEIEGENNFTVGNTVRNTLGLQGKSTFATDNGETKAATDQFLLDTTDDADDDAVSEAYKFNGGINAGDCLVVEDGVDAGSYPILAVEYFERTEGGEVIEVAEILSMPRRLTVDLGGGTFTGATGVNWHVELQNPLIRDYETGSAHSTPGGSLIWAEDSASPGLVGVAPDAVCVPYRADDTISSMIVTIEAAIKKGCHVMYAINRASVDVGSHQPVNVAIQAAKNAGMTIISATANNPNLELSHSFGSGSYFHTPVIVLMTGVGLQQGADPTLDREDLLDLETRGYAAFGAPIDLAGPDSGLNSLEPGNPGARIDTQWGQAAYQFNRGNADMISLVEKGFAQDQLVGIHAFAGTSQAFAMATGVCALVWEAIGGERSRSNSNLVDSIMEKTAEYPRNTGLNKSDLQKFFGKGRLNARKAVEKALLMK